MSALVLALRITATLAAVAFVYGVWAARTGITWTAWLGQLLAAEALGFLVGGTFSGFVWFLRAHPTALALAGALLTAVVVWLVQHFWVERDLLPSLRRTYADDGIIAALAFVLSFLTSRRRGRR